MTINVGTVNEFTIAQDLASWNRQRTSEELRSFVERRLGQVALDNIK